MSDDTPAWRVEIAARAARDLRRLDPPVRKRVLAAVQQIASDEPRGDVRQLTGRPEQRLRVGDWRVLFERNAGVRVIAVVRVLPRGRTYDR